MARAAAALLSLALSAPLSAQTVQEITEEGLGYPPPLPVESLTPVDGFRTWASLEARFLELSLAAEHVARHEVGDSLFERDIFVYTVGNGAEPPPGEARPSAFILGGAHAREWASPEVVAELLEWFALEAPGDPLGAYLLDALHLVIVPVSNPDGFVKTQNHPVQTVFGGSTGWGGRDGRMRRKNLRNATETLDPPDNYREGVDLNRNFPVGWRSVSQTLITYGGTEAGSEPETQAVHAAEEFLEGTQLRLFLDFHSFGQFYYVVQTGDGMDTATGEAYEAMRDAAGGETGIVYTRSNWLVPSMSIGASDEYFATEYGAMAYTPEIRPSGGTNPFILPDAQVDAARREMRAATLAGLYYAAGPAWLQHIEFRDTTESAWEDAPAVHVETRETGAQPGERLRNVTASEAMLPGRVYTGRLRFNKPMRGAEGGALLPGFEAEEPALSLGAFAPAETAWRTSHYAGDTLEVRWEIPGGAMGPPEITLSVYTADGVGRPLDGDPAAAARWDGADGWAEWTREADEWSTLAFEGVPLVAPSEVWVLW